MSARSATREALHRLIARMRARKALTPIDAATLNALRDFGAQCYQLGWCDAHDATTAPVMRSAELDTGRYSITHPHHPANDNKDKER